MKALILSCNTGGGHNSAARAIAEEMHDRGDEAYVPLFRIANNFIGSVYGQFFEKISSRFLDRITPARA